MLNCFIRNFVRLINRDIFNNKQVIRKIPINYCAGYRKFYSNPHDDSEKPTDSEPSEGTNFLDSDDFISNYPSYREKSFYISRDAAVEELRAKMRFSEKEAQKILKADSKLRRIRFKEFTKIIDMILKNVITKTTVMNNPWMLSTTARNFEAKLLLLYELKPRNINEIIPLLRVSIARLSKIVHIAEKEADFIPGGNRIYYISDKLDIEPAIVSKFLSKRLFMLEIPYDMLSKNLNLMIEYEVAPLNILRDLWAFRYTPRSVKARLERAKRAQKDKIMPWMVRCTEPILEKSLHLSIEEKKLLGENKTKVDFIAQRLRFDNATTRAIMLKHPAVFKVRVAKIKEVLDYLLDEFGFTNIDVAQTPRILCHSLKTTKNRLDELQSFGCRPSSLVIVCRSRREYQKFLNNWNKNTIRYANKQ